MTLHRAELMQRSESFPITTYPVPVFKMHHAIRQTSDMSITVLLHHVTICFSDLKTLQNDIAACYGDISYTSPLPDPSML